MRSWVKLFWRRREFDKIIAAILFPRALVVSIGERLVFTVTESVHAIGGDAEADELLTASQPAAFTERAIVLFRAAFVAVSFDAHRSFRMVLQIIGHGGDLGFIRGRHGGAVIGEMN